MADFTGKYFEIYKDTSGEWRWRLRSEGNHKIIATSGEGYKNRGDCAHGARLVAAVAPGAGLWDSTGKEWIK